MSKTITIDILRQIATDSISVYDALKRAHTLTEESKRILTIAEDLLRYAGLAYLSEIPVSKLAPTTSASSARDEMISAYITIRQSYADLGDALYRLANALIGEGVADKACVILEALLKIDPNYRNVADMLRQSLLAQAKALFEQKKWEEGRAVLKQRPADKEIRLVYLSSFLDESDFEMFQNGIQLHRERFALQALQNKEPQVNELPLFHLVLNAVDALRCAEIEVYGIEERIHNRKYEDSRDLEELRRGAYDKWTDTVLQFKGFLYDLRTELPSIV